MDSSTILPTPRKVDWQAHLMHFQALRQQGNCPSDYAQEQLAFLVDDTAAAFLQFVVKPLGHPQAYELVISSAGVVVTAESAIGFVYAAMTLRQLLAKKPSGWELPCGAVKDCPKINTRGVNWNLFAEIRGWSQDDAKGIDAFRQNFITGLDLLVEYKLNFAFVDGLGWNAERFPGYGNLMRQLNAEARRRGVHLCYSGYSSGYGEQHEEFDGHGFENRQSYPDGELYPCMGFAVKPISRYQGTCLSNEKLLALKCAQLQEFVRTVEPGALYIHGLDISREEEARVSWQQRCPDCRQRWPNEQLSAEDGMAGACAHLFNALAAVLDDISNPETGYVAARDCQLHMVGPNYTSAHEPDEEWDYHLDYFATVFRLLTRQNVFLMLREQFFGDVPGVARMRQLRERVGSAAQLSCVYFAAGSGFYDSSIISGDAPAMTLLSDCNAVIAGNGNAFQQTRQVLNAQFLWNPDCVSPASLPSVATRMDFLRQHKPQAFGISNTAELFDPGGLFDLACVKLYGARAGALVAKAQRLRTKFGDKYSHTTPIWNATMPNWRFSNFKLVRWQENLTPEALQQAQELQALLAELQKLNRRAAKLYDRAAECADRQQCYLLRMARTCALAAELQELMVPWLRLLQEAAGHKPLRRLAQLQKKVQSTRQRLQRRRRHAIDPNGGDFGFALEQTKLLSREIAAIVWSCKRPGNFRPVNELIYHTQRQ